MTALRQAIVHAPTVQFGRDAGALGVGLEVQQPGVMGAVRAEGRQTRADRAGVLGQH